MPVERSRLSCILPLIGALVFFATAVHAAPLLPNSTATPNVLGTLAGTIVSAGGTVTTIAFPVSSTNPTFSGILRAAVVDPGTPGGGLDFYYQISNDLTSFTGLKRMTDFMFNGYSTHVFYRTDTVAGFATPVSTSAAPPPIPLASDRDGSGHVVGFDYSFDDADDPDITKINPGETSLIVVIRTNAPSFTSGFTSLINGGTMTLDTFQPFGNPVPEPASLILLGSAFAVAGGLARRHQAKQRRAA